MNTLATAPYRPADPMDAQNYFDIDNGQRKEIAPMGAYANFLATYLATVMNQFALPRDLGFAVNETLHRLSEEKSRRPDVSFVTKEAMPSLAVLRADPAELDFAPQLAAEVVSPTNTAEDMEEKVFDFFAAGVEIVWVIYPRQRRVHVHESAQDCRILTDSQELTGGQILPGFRLKVADLFDLAKLPSL